MSAGVFKLCKRIIVVAMALVVAMSIVRETSIFLPLGSVIVALLLLRLCRRFTKEIMMDERIRRIDEKAAALSYRAFSTAMAILALVFIMLRTNLPPEFSIIGTTMAYSVCALMLMHLAFYYYYEHRL